MKSCVLTTRSPDQVRPMLARLRQCGLAARNLPLLTFNRQTLTIEGSAPDWLIAISPAAIRHGWQQLPASWQQQPRLAAVGPGTLAYLQQRAVRPVLAPEDGGGQALLAMLPGDLHGERIALLGTEVLSPSLRAGLQARGATVEGLSAALSRTVQPSAKRVAALLSRYDQVLTTLMSQRALQALQTLASPQLQALQQQPLFVISERLAEIADEAGWQRIHSARQATLDGLCQSVIDWHRNNSESTA